MTSINAELRVGQGFDVHALVPGRRLVIGGVVIEHAQGLLGHSDADVLLHAVTDALLGAAGLPDIGALFPDDDLANRDADSAVLLKKSWGLVCEQAWSLVNLDAVIIAQSPKIAPHRQAMRQRIAAILGVEPGQINLRGKTFEHLGSLGRGEGIAAQAVCLLRRRD